MDALLYTESCKFTLNETLLKPVFSLSFFFSLHKHYYKCHRGHSAYKWLCTVQYMHTEWTDNFFLLLFLLFTTTYWQITEKPEALCNTWWRHRWSAGILINAFAALHWETHEVACLSCPCACWFARVLSYTEWEDTPPPPLQCKLSNCWRDCIRALWDTNVETRGRSDRKRCLCQGNVYLNAWALQCMAGCMRHSRIHQAFFLAQQKILGNLNV